MGFRTKPAGSTLSETLILVQTLLGLSRFGGPLENKIADKRSRDDSAHGLRSELRSPGAKETGPPRHLSKSVSDLHSKVGCAWPIAAEELL